MISTGLLLQGRLVPRTSPLLQIQGLLRRDCVSSCGVELALGGADHLPSDVYTVIRFCENKHLIAHDLQRNKNSWDLFLV